MTILPSPEAVTKSDQRCMSLHTFISSESCPYCPWASRHRLRYRLGVSGVRPTRIHSPARPPLPEMRPLRRSVAATSPPPRRWSRRSGPPPKEWLAPLGRKRIYQNSEPACTGWLIWSGINFYWQGKSCTRVYVIWCHVNKWLSLTR